jgi:RND family efflux transporter MFP subunit
LAAGCSGNEPTAAGEKKEDPIAVTIAHPSQNSSAGITASGQVEAVNTASISTRLMGTITGIYVKVGDKVRQGQLLATISSDEISAKQAQADAQIAGAQADMENAQKDLARYKVLFSRQSATQTELDNVTLRSQAAQSRLEAARQMRREVDASGTYARLMAPFSGIVTQKLVDQGSLALPGATILTVEERDGLRVNAIISESDISRVQSGDKAEITIKSTGLTTTGLVTQISVSSIATGGQYMAKIDLPREAQKSLYSGMYANVYIPLKEGNTDGATTRGSNESIWVPATALVQKDQLTGIYTVSNMHTALLRWVRTGKKAGDRVEILSGINAGESFISDAFGKLYNGVPVIEK